MDLPPLVDYDTVREYRAHFERKYCRDTIYTSDGIRIYFPLISSDTYFMRAQPGTVIRICFPEHVRSV